MSGVLHKRTCGSVQTCVLALVLWTFAPYPTGAQEIFSTGQNVAPIFEGWEQNSDGTSSIVFGYLNRNYDEKLEIPIGPNNKIEPDGPDRGQPTYFLPRRNLFIFRVTVPKDFGQKELVWTVTAHGKTESAYATLRPEYLIDDEVIMLNTADIRGGEAGNRRPSVAVEGERQRTARVGEPLRMIAVVSDDGKPKPRPAPPPASAIASALGLRVAWFVYRGDEKKVTFDPRQFKVYPDYRSDSPWTMGWTPPPLPPDGKFPVAVTFTSPGTYVIRVMAHDGGLASIEDVHVIVN